MTIFYDNNTNTETDVVNVKSFGAIGDGVHDDTQAIQDAINSINEYQGGVVVLPATAGTYKISSTITVSGKAGIVIQGLRSPVVPGQLATNYPSSISWVGASGGTMLHIVNPRQISIKDIELRGGISGVELASTALYIDQSNAGWGISNYENIATDWCNKAPVVIEGAVDGGRNMFFRCRFWNRHNQTGIKGDDSVVLYKNCNNVTDNWIKCELISDDGLNNKPSGCYSMYISGGSPDIFMTDCYTRSHSGIEALSGSGPSLTFLRHYSEDTDFLTLPSINNRQTLIASRHISTDGGYSILAAGGGTGGKAFTIDGGRYIGDVEITGRGPVVISNNPTFDGTLTIPDARDVVRIGRNGNYGTTSVGAINAHSFIPATAVTQSGINIYPNPYIGQILPVSLTNNATVQAPTNIDAVWDIGRELELHITGHATNTYTVNFNSTFKLAGGTYTHSGATKLDIITFRYDGSRWAEIYRSMNITP